MLETRSKNDIKITDRRETFNAQCDSQDEEDNAKHNYYTRSNNKNKRDNIEHNENSTNNSKNDALSESKTQNSPSTDPGAKSIEEWANKIEKLEHVHDDTIN